MPIPNPETAQAEAPEQDFGKGFEDIAEGFRNFSAAVKDAAEKAGEGVREMGNKFKETLVNSDVYDKFDSALEAANRKIEEAQKSAQRKIDALNESVTSILSEEMVDTNPEKLSGYVGKNKSPSVVSEIAQKRIEWEKKHPQNEDPIMKYKGKDVHFKWKTDYDNGPQEVLLSGRRKVNLEKDAGLREAVQEEQRWQNFKNKPFPGATPQAEQADQGGGGAGAAAEEQEQTRQNHENPTTGLGAVHSENTDTHDEQQEKSWEDALREEVAAEKSIPRKKERIIQAYEKLRSQELTEIRENGEIPFYTRETEKVAFEGIEVPITKYTVIEKLNLNVAGDEARIDDFLAHVLIKYAKDYPSAKSYCRNLAKIMQVESGPTVYGDEVAIRTVLMQRLNNPDLIEEIYRMKGEVYKRKPSEREGNKRPATA